MEVLKVAAGTDEQYEVVEQIQHLLNEQVPDFVQQHIIVALLLASHVCRAKEKNHAEQMLDNLFGQVWEMVKNSLETRQ